MENIVMNTCREKIAELMFNQDVYTYFYIDYKQNEWHLEENPGMPEFTMSQTDNPIDSILKSGKLAIEDAGRFSMLAERLKGGNAFGSEDKFIKAQFRLNQVLGAVWYEIKVYPDFEEDGTVNVISGTLHRLSDREIKNRNILNFYTNDKNPAIFADLMAKRIRENLDTQFAVIQFDVIGFKFINDKYGEAIGNEILHYINDVLDIYCNESQIYSRLSADVFMVVIPYEEISDIYDFLRGLEAAMSGYKGIKYTIAFGVYLVEDRSIATRIMGDSAGLARAAAKSSALENIAFFNKDEKSKLKTQRTIEDRMKSALKNREFVMYLQPKYSISESKLIGAEALVRWIDPEKGLVPPNDFIPVFEKNGFVIKIDEFIWEAACQEIRKWMDKGITPVPISVNVSRVHLNNGEFLEHLNALIEKYGIPKEYLELEITESAENINSNAMIQEAKAQGFRLLMDDFGSGYSSLNTLKNTPFDVLKIDRSFISSSMESQRGQKIISHTIAMSQDIGLDLIAEGVETKEQADFLYTCGCDAAQGFLYSRPVPIIEFDKMMFRNKDE
ncbi:MAG: GGDEF domain-containing phosphodiesterase [Firmicutes bacterium]|nr:GGDEF domain-containing phosphodiesterase [[Eubacterium] siraeum]MCM1489030.1 GGDEF domain-containing phosphodiesterase [Bacillota bacterium]